MAALLLEDPAAARELIEAYRTVGVSHLVQTGPYPDEVALRHAIDRLAALGPAARER